MDHQSSIFPSLVQSQVRKQVEILVVNQEESRVIRALALEAMILSHLEPARV